MATDAASMSLLSGPNRSPSQRTYSPDQVTQLRYLATITCWPAMVTSILMVGSRNSLAGKKSRVCSGRIGACSGASSRTRAQSVRLSLRFRWASYGSQHGPEKVANHLSVPRSNLCSAHDMAGIRG